MYLIGIEFVAVWRRARSLRWRSRSRSRSRCCPRCSGSSVATSTSSTYRSWARRCTSATGLVPLVAAHPTSTLARRLAGLLILLVLASPMTAIELGSSDAGVRPTTDTTRRAYDLLADGFGPGFNGPLLLVVQVPASAPPDALAKLQGRRRQERRCRVRRAGAHEPRWRHRGDSGVPDDVAAGPSHRAVDPSSSQRRAAGGDTRHGDCKRTSAASPLRSTM